MQNPCKKCLLQNNCSEICDSKINFKTLVDNALKSYMVYRKKSIDRQFELYKKWYGYKKENDDDFQRINKRALILKRGGTLLER